MNANLRIRKWQASDLGLKLDNQNEHTLTHGGLHARSISLNVHCEYNLQSYIASHRQASEDSWHQCAKRKVLVLEDLDR